MEYVNMHAAKTQLSKLIDALESGREHEITIARNGRPVARLVPARQKRPIRLGIAKGEFVVPDDIDRDNAEIARLFYGEDA
jgi:prevent-host-death family protein